MHGVQGPGGPRWGVAPGRGGSRTFGRDVYVRRRILAVLVVLLLLALLVPRACQALLGSNEDTGPREHQKAGAPETATGAGGGTKGTAKTETKDTASDRGVPLVKESSEDTSGAATTDLTAMVTELAVIGGDETFAAEDAAGEGPSADESTQGPAGPSLVGARQTVVAPQNAPETSRAPAERPPSGAERAPAHRQVLSSTAIPPVTTPARERIRGRRDLAATVPVAVEPVAVESVPAVPADTAFVPRGTSVRPLGAGTNLGGNAVRGAVSRGATLNRIGAAPAGGPRRTVAGPVRTRRPAVF